MVVSSEAVVRAYFEAWNRRDMDALAAILDPRVEWRRSADFPEGRMLRGRDSLLDFARAMFEVFVETPIDLDECSECADGTVLVRGTTRFLGERSGAETSSSWTRLYRVADGRVRSIRAFASRTAAIEAVGARSAP